MEKTNEFAHGPSTIKLGDLEVNRLGFGAMRLPGKEVWGEPQNIEEARAVLRKTREFGINFIDTAWYYGPYVANRLIKETLYPYQDGLVIACKLGARRLPDKSWVTYIRPEELRKGCEDDLKTLKLDRIDIVHLRTTESNEVPFLESLDALIDLQKEGKIRHIALSNIKIEKIETALQRTPIVAVQNMYSVSGSTGFLAGMSQSEGDAVLEMCNEKGIAFIPFFPFQAGSLLKPGTGLSNFAKERGINTAQIALALLLARSPVMLPIPGTGSTAHLSENWEARKLHLSEDDISLIMNAL